MKIKVLTKTGNDYKVLLEISTEVYHKVRHVGGTTIWSLAKVLLQSASVITTCDKTLLQTASGVTKFDDITRCDCFLPLTIFVKYFPVDVWQIIKYASVEFQVFAFYYHCLDTASTNW